jgi:hypothetical protein
MLEFMKIGFKQVAFGGGSDGGGGGGSPTAGLARVQLWKQPSYRRHDLAASG